MKAIIKLKFFVVGIAVGLIAISCGSGSKRVDLEDIVILSAEKSVWGECIGEKKHLVETHVCKMVCTKWKKEKCKKEKEIELEFKKAVKNNYKMIKFSMLLDLMSN